MTNATWIAGSADWTVAADWSDGIAPNDPVTDATIDVASPATITLASSESYIADSLTIGSADTTFSLAGTLALASGATVNAGALQLAGGTLTSSTAQNATLDQAGGALTLLNIDSKGTLDNISVFGPVFVPNGGLLTLTGNSAIFGDSAETTPGAVTIGYGALQVDVASSGTGTVGYSVSTAQGGSTLLIGGTGSAEPVLLIAAGADIDDVPIQPAVPANGLAVINRGTLADISLLNLTENAGTIESPSGPTTVGNASVKWTNDATGLITASRNTLTLQNDFTNAGTISATSFGVVVLGSGAGTTWTNTGQIDPAGGKIQIDADETAADIGTVNVSNGGVLQLAGGTLDNTGGALSAANTNLLGLQLAGGTIEGRVLDASLGLRSVTSFGAGLSALDNVAVIGGTVLDGMYVALAGSSAVYTDSSKTTLATITLGNGELYLTGSDVETLSQSVSFGAGLGYIVRVHAGAFGAGLPRRDLWLSPDHAVFFDGVLIPVRHLINGRTIVQKRVPRVTYYHLELPDHDVILAEGLPCESYLDTGNRASFGNHDGPIRLHPDFSTLSWEVLGCAPLIVTGPQLDAARVRLAAIADKYWRLLLPRDTERGQLR